MVQQCEINAVQLALLPLIHNPNWTNAAEIIADAGITIVSGMLEASGEDYTSLETIAKTGGLRQEAMWESTIENTKRVANSAAEIGIPLVTFHAGFIPEERCNERSKMLDHLHMMTEVCIDCGVSLGLETGQESAGNAASILIELRLDELGVNFDPANMILYGKGDPIEAMNILQPWVQQVHIKDAKHTEVQGTWGTEVPVGKGDVAWESFLKLVPEHVNLVIEREGGANRINDIKQAKQMLQELGAC